MSQFLQLINCKEKLGEGEETYSLDERQQPVVMYGPYLNPDSDFNKIRHLEKFEHLLGVFNVIKELLLSISGCDNGVSVILLKFLTF